VFDVARGPVIRGADGRERSALTAEAAVPQQVSTTTPQTAAYWAAAFNSRHPRVPAGRLQLHQSETLRRYRDRP